MSGAEIAFILASTALSAGASVASSLSNKPPEDKSKYLSMLEKRDAEAARQAAENEAQAIKKRKGFSSSITTGGEGVLGEPSTQKTLLGQ